MPHKLFKLQEKLYNIPHLITQDSFDQILSYIERRNSTEDIPIESTHLSILGPVSRSIQDLCYNSDTGVGILSIDGPLTYKPVFNFATCGTGCSYQRLESDFQVMADAGASTIVLDCTSGGGEASHVFETANNLRAIADAYGIKLIAYVDTLAASACYALTCISDEIIANGDAKLGSIGVVVCLVNPNRALKDAGYDRTYLTAGSAKVPFDNNGEWKDGFLESIQTSIDELYKTFTEFVAENRGLSVETVRSTEANVYSAKQALEIGLADKVMTREEFFTYLADVNQNKSSRLSARYKPTKRMSLSNENSEIEMNKLTELEAKCESLASELKLSQEELLTFKAKAEELVKLASENTSLKAEVQKFKELQAKQEAEALATKMQARKEKLSAVVDAEKAETLFASTEALPDAAFDAIYETLKMQDEVLKKNPAFKEIGAGGQGKEVEASKEDGVTALLKQKYKVNE